MEYMRFVIDSKHLRKILDPIAEMKKDAKGGKASTGRTINFECTREKIYIKEISANVLFLLFELDEEIITDYENDLQEDEKLQIIVDLDKLIQSTIDVDGKLNFDVDVKNKKLLVETGYYKYKLGFKIDKKEAKFPNIDFEQHTVRINMKGIDLYKIFKKCSGLDKYLLISISGSEDEYVLKFSSKDEGTDDSIDVELNPEFDVTKYKIDSETEVMIDSSIGYVDVTKVMIEKVPDVKLFIKNNSPIALQFEIEEGHGKVTFGIAPRAIENK